MGQGKARLPMRLWGIRNTALRMGACILARSIFWRCNPKSALERGSFCRFRSRRKSAELRFSRFFAQWETPQATTKAFCRDFGLTNRFYRGSCKKDFLEVR